MTEIEKNRLQCLSAVINEMDEESLDRMLMFTSGFVAGQKLAEINKEVDGLFDKVCEVCHV